MSKSKDIREAVVRVIEGGGTYADAAQICGVGVASVSRWLRLKRETGSVDERPRGGGNRSPLTGELAKQLVELVTEDDNRTDEELCRAFVAQTGVSTSRSAIRRALLRMGFARKKSRSQRPRGTDRT